MTRLIILFLLVSSRIFGQTGLQFFPENMMGNRSFNYQHLIITELTGKIRFTNFSYLDSDYNGKDNLYNIRNSFSYSLLENWSGNIAFGLKNPGFYASLSAGFRHRVKFLSFVARTGITYQDGFSSESFASVRYSPAISERMRLLLRATFSFNLDKEGITRGIQQFRIGLSQNRLSCGIAGNFDQFNYNRKKLQNHGIFLALKF